MVTLQVKLFAVFIGVILVTATGIYWFESTNIQVPDDDPDPDPDPTPTPTAPEVSLSFTLTSNSTYRGDNFQGILAVTSDQPISLHNISFSLNDSNYNRTGQQIIPLNSMVNTSASIPIALSPAFPGGSGAVIAQPETIYNISVAEVIFNSSEFYYSQIVNSTHSVSITDPPVHDQAQNLVWEFIGNATLASQNATHASIDGLVNQTYILQTKINGTGYTRIDYNSTTINSTLNFLIDGRQVAPNNGYVPIGNYLNETDFAIVGKFNGTGSSSFNISILTKKITLFAVVANDQWEQPSIDGFNFRGPEFYIRQASTHFEYTLNVSIVPAVRVTLPPTALPDLFILSNIARTTVGTDLGLVNATWAFGPGTFKENQGYDILLIFTNKTMNNLGVVLGTQGQGAFNMAIHARGSLNTGNYRLPPQFADNLIQHEVSHIFGAPDRFTSTSEPSVMTKSTADDALIDIISGIFWLFQINWLEDDIQTMTDDLITTYWDYTF